MQPTQKDVIARSKVCLALDNLETIEEFRQYIEELSPYVGMFKIGKESFTRFGPTCVEIVHQNNAEVFLDLKYHDIPHTVEGAAKAAAQMGVFIFDIHASGGSEMMKAAVLGATQGAQHSKNKRIPKIIAVTVLTSLDEQTLKEELAIAEPLDTHVLRLASLAHDVGLDGIVCSAKDLDSIKDKLPSSFMFVTPGIKAPGTQAAQDQKRVFTPAKAIKAGSSILVIGRAITGHDTSEERIAAAKKILEDIAQGYK